MTSLIEPGKGQIERSFGQSKGQKKDDRGQIRRQKSRGKVDLSSDIPSCSLGERKRVKEKRRVSGFFLVGFSGKIETKRRVFWEKESPLEKQQEKKRKERK